MKAIAFTRTTEMNLLARVAKVTTSGNTVLVKWDNYTDVEFKLVNGLLKVEKVRVNFDTVYASIFGTKWDQFKDKHRTHIGAALIALGAEEFIIRTDFVIGLVDRLDNSSSGTPVHRPQEALCKLEGATTISQHRKEPVYHTNNNDSTVELLGAVLGLGISMMRRR